MIDTFFVKKNMEKYCQHYEDALLMVCSDKTAINYIITRDKEFLQMAKSSML